MEELEKIIITKKEEIELFSEVMPLISKNVKFQICPKYDGCVYLSSLIFADDVNLNEYNYEMDICRKFPCACAKYKQNN
ncbi:MAG: hypothetical protein KKF48_05290 [Nanoarchaeota archaeon]|nr:hypothetical protein [Nanoarchaeota archaeon]MBU1028433.1 hypothetical protein [Nanoarchaeota archaeon]